MYWTRFYLPAACFAVPVLLAVMAFQHGNPRGVIAAIVLASGNYVLRTRRRLGWKVESSAGHELKEG